MIKIVEVHCLSLEPDDNDPYWIYINPGMISHFRQIDKDIFEVSMANGRVIYIGRDWMIKLKKHIELITEAT